MQDSEVVTFSKGDYFSLLWVVMAAILGCLLLGGTAAVGVNDINRIVLTGTPTANVVNFIISNLNTAIVATVGEFSTLVPPPVFQSTPTATPSPTVTNLASPTSIFLIHPTSTSRGNSFTTPISTGTYTSVPTSTSTKIPTSTVTKVPPPPPTSTNTPIPANTPTPTDTLIPTNTPAPTDTVVPTNTVQPTDTDTPVVPTDTPSSYP